jgi:GTP-binding protein
VIVRAEFVTSAVSAEGLPRDGLAEIALVGRSNVGKSSLINALAGRTIARTSATPGKTRLINLYRVVVAAGGRAPAPERNANRQAREPARATRGERTFYFVDLPGYGYAPGVGSAESLQTLAQAYAESRWDDTARHDPPTAALLLVDVRHPGLDNDLAAYDWLASLARPAAVVATKLDKLSRAERQRARQILDTAFNGPVLPVSAASGEGMKDLWTLIDRLLSKHPPRLKPRQA